MKKLTQKELDDMVLQAIGEGEAKAGSKPNALQKLLNRVRLKKEEAGKGETK